MKGIRSAQSKLKNMQEHILVIGVTGTGKSTLLTKTKIPDSKYFDFIDLCKNKCFQHYLCEENGELFFDTLLASNEKTLILDAVHFPVDLNSSTLVSFIKKASEQDKRLIVVTFPSEAERIEWLFGAVISMSGRRNNDRECCVKIV
ncbi:MULTISPECIES: hypothetical protein [Serratia]|uniref:hypothetical protein n=1 Tax=Serratia TaxID=613 RepID=UPI00080BA47D|nr:hypothetical protein [Serratia sp. 506_PEND]